MKRQQHQKQINDNLGETKTQLNKMTNEITQTLEKIETRENIINSQFESLVTI